MKPTSSGPQLPLDLTRTGARPAFARTEWSGAPGLSESHLFSAWASLLYRYSRQETFTLAVAATNQAVPAAVELAADVLAGEALTRLGGLYSNTLAVLGSASTNITERGYL